MLVYHYTDTARLPHIAYAQALKPGANRVGGYPDPDFVWATSSPLGDRTASGGRNEAYRQGHLRLVRLSFESEYFFPWCEVSARFPTWEPHFVEALELSARGKSDPKLWWCHDGPLDLDACLNIDTRSYTDPRWLELEGEIALHVDPELGESCVGIEILGKIHASMRLDDGKGRVGYRAMSFPAK